jgi:hypothetical protein
VTPRRLLVLVLLVVGCSPLEREATAYVKAYDPPVFAFLLHTNIVDHFAVTAIWQRTHRPPVRVRADGEVLYASPPAGSWWGWSDRGGVFVCDQEEAGCLLSAMDPAHPEDGASELVEVPRRGSRLEKGVMYSWYHARKAQKQGDVQ